MSSIVRSLPECLQHQSDRQFSLLPSNQQQSQRKYLALEDRPQRNRFLTFTKNQEALLIQQTTYLLHSVRRHAEFTPPNIATFLGRELGSPAHHISKKGAAFNIII